MSVSYPERVLIARASRDMLHSTCATVRRCARQPRLWPSRMSSPASSAGRGRCGPRFLAPARAVSPRRWSISSTSHRSATCLSSSPEGAPPPLGVCTTCGPRRPTSSIVKVLARRLVRRRSSVPVTCRSAAISMSASRSSSTSSVDAPGERTFLHHGVPGRASMPRLAMATSKLPAAASFSASRVAAKGERHTLARHTMRTSKANETPTAQGLSGSGHVTGRLHR